MTALATHPKRPRVPRYQIAERAVLDRIAKGVYGVGERLANVDHLADELGVSPSTMRQSLQSLAAKGVVDCVPGRGTTVNPKAMQFIHGSTQEGRSRAFSIIVPDIRYAEFSTLAHSVGEAVREHQCDLTVSNTEDRIDRYVEELDRTIRSGVRGIVLVPPLNQPLPLETLMQIKASKIPTVTCFRPLDLPSVPSVLQDVFATQRDAADHLLAGGCRVLGMAYVETTSPVTRQIFREGLHGHKDAIMRHRLDYRDDLLLGLDAAGSYQEWADSYATPGASLPAEQESRLDRVTRWLEANPDLDGVVCFNDYLSGVVMEAAARLGRAVPDDLAVIARGSVGFQAWTPRPVTMMDVNLDAFGRTACGLLQRMLDGETFDPGYTELIGASLVERATTRPRKPAPKTRK